MHIACDAARRLAGAHDPEIVVRADAEVRHDRIQNFAVLPGQTHETLHAGGLVQLQDERTHLDRLGACAEQTHDFQRFHGFGSPSFRSDAEPQNDMRQKIRCAIPAFERSP